MMQQQAAGAGEFAQAWRMVAEGTPSTKIIMAALAVFSLLSWALIVWKLLQFRRLRRDSDRFLDRLEGADRLDAAWARVASLPESPFTRVFSRGMKFFGEMQPHAAVGAATSVITAPRPGLTPTQLEVLRIVLEKEEAEERDELTAGLYWLAIIATVSPLLGLLGTVLGVMNSFVGVAGAGSSSINVVAPGIAEALVVTAGGLVAAIPAAMGYNYLTARLERVIGELEGFSSEFIGSLAREGHL